MIRFAWFRFRTQALVALGVLAVLAVVLVVTGIRLAHAYAAAVAACKPHGDCATALSLFPSHGYLTASNGMHLLVIAIPCVLGMFWGAPLAAREFETGTFRLAWTQGSHPHPLAGRQARRRRRGEHRGRRAAQPHGDLVEQPIAAAQMTARLDPAFFSKSGIAPVGYAAFAFASESTAGLLSRRTLPAMAVTLAIFAAVVWFAFPLWVRPHLLPPAQTTVPLSTTSINGYVPVGDGRMVVQTAPPDLPGAWILSNQLTTPAGRPAPTIPATQACASNTSSGQTCNAYVESLHLRQTVTYEPASRYWPLQWYETGIYLALALALAGLCLWWIRPGHFAGLNIRRRTSQPARHSKVLRDCDRQLYMANDDRRDLGIRLNHQLQMAESPSSTLAAWYRIGDLTCMFRCSRQVHLGDRHL